jgi:hypothetical protein
MSTLTTADYVRHVHSYHSRLCSTCPLSTQQTMSDMSTLTTADYVRHVYYQHSRLCPTCPLLPQQTMSDMSTLTTADYARHVHYQPHCLLCEIPQVYLVCMHLINIYIYILWVKRIHIYLCLIILYILCLSLWKFNFINVTCYQNYLIWLKPLNFG